jgi:hypothetical protein
MDAVTQYCTDEGRAAHTAAASRDICELIELALSSAKAATTKTLKGKPAADDTASHPNRRFEAYKPLAVKFNYHGLRPRQRVPHPLIVELIIKACLPGHSPAAFTCFVPRIVDDLRRDWESRDG